MKFNLENINKGFLILSWALYDLANQFFALNIVSLYFIRWLVVEKKVPEVFYSVSLGISMLLVAVIAPILGFISDFTERRRIFLVYFTLLSIIFSILMGLTQNIFLVLLYFCIANFGCQMGTVFYNALLVNIAPENKTGFISGLGKMFSYAGAILSIYLIQPIVLKQGYQATFAPTGILFLIFALPCMIFIKDTAPKDNVSLLRFFERTNLFKTAKVLKSSMLELYKTAGISHFLKSAFFGLCAVNVVIVFMSIYATKVFGLNETQIVNLIAFSTLFAIIGSLISGFISDYLGYKLCLSLIYVLWIICFFIGAVAKSTSLYFLLGAITGIALGATWVVSRALAISLVPKEKISEVFGLLNFAGVISGVLGVSFWGLILFFLRPLNELGYRIALLSLSLFMFLGLYFLLTIPQKINQK